MLTFPNGEFCKIWFFTEKKPNQVVWTQIFKRDSHFCICRKLHGGPIGFDVQYYTFFYFNFLSPRVKLGSYDGIVGKKNIVWSTFWRRSCNKFDFLLKSTIFGRTRSTHAFADDRERLFSSAMEFRSKTIEKQKNYRRTILSTHTRFPWVSYDIYVLLKINKKKKKTSYITPVVYM